MIDRRQRRRRDGTSYTVYRVRYHDGDGERSKTFDRLDDARAFEAKVRVLKRRDALADLDAGTETLAEFAQEWWRLYAGPNLERATLQVYARMYNKHVLPRLGEQRLRDLTPQRIARFRADLEADGVGVETIRKSMALLQGMLQRAVEWDRLTSNPGQGDAQAGGPPPGSLARPSTGSSPPSSGRLVRPASASSVSRWVPASRVSSSSVAVIAPRSTSLQTLACFPPSREPRLRR